MRRPCGCYCDPLVFGHRDCTPPALTWRTRYLRALANGLTEPLPSAPQPQEGQ